MDGASALLVGPPELRNCVRSDDSRSQPSPPSLLRTGDDFMDMFNEMGVNSQVQEVPMGFTENASATYLSSGNACLDFFFQVVPDTPPASLIRLLRAAWKQDPLTALKLLFNLRGVRGTGKTDREGFYTAVRWMHSAHPKTLLANASAIAQFGYLKDLPEILFRVLEGAEATENRKALREIHRKKIEAAKSKSGGRRPRPGSYGRGGYFARKGAAAREARRLGMLKPRDDRIADDLAKGRALSQLAALARKTKRLEGASRALNRYSQDSDYRALHDRVASIFAVLLSQDLEALRCSKLFEISLAAKWCPSLDSSYDRSTLLCENIARTLFPRHTEEEPRYSEMEHRHYVYRVRDRLRKEVLVPLRKALELPEVFMSANLWDRLPYGRVASVAMKNYKDIFLKHDAHRFNAYLRDVADGNKKIAAGALLPHEIIKHALESGAAVPSVAELQWKRMVDDMTKLGKFSNSLAVCDVSGSMDGLPMEVCVALGLLVSEMSQQPWKGHIITFSRKPQLHLIQGESLVDKYKFAAGMDWGMNTDFQKVFDLILRKATESGLRPEKMIRRLFVFSDMEFDRASKNSWETDYTVIKRKFGDAGYGEPPEIVFWNLRNSQSTPVVREQNGVAMVSGFSKNLLKLFLQNDGDMNPLLVMNRAITGKLYEDLVVVD